MTVKDGHFRRLVERQAVADPFASAEEDDTIVDDEEEEEEGDEGVLETPTSR